MNPLLRAYYDLLAYGRHLECCKSGGGPMVAGPNAVRIKPLYVDRDGVKHWAPCSCGLKEALDGLEKELGFGKWREVQRKSEERAMAISTTEPNF